MTGQPVKLGWQPIITGVQRKKEQKEERFAIECQFVLSYSEIENDVLATFLSLDCSLRHIQTTRGQLFPLLPLPSVCFAHFALTCLLDLKAICCFLNHLSYFASFPASVCSQFVSELAATCRPKHCRDSCGCLKNSVAAAFFSCQFEQSLQHQRLFGNKSAVIMICNFLPKQPNRKLNIYFPQTPSDINTPIMG